MPLTILIIGNQTEPILPEPLGQEENHLRVIYAPTPLEAERRIKQTPPHLVLAVFDSESTAAGLSVRRMLENHPSAKIMIFPAWQELLHSFQAFRTLTAAQIKNLLITPPQQAGPLKPGPPIEQFHYDGLIGKSREIHKLKEIILKIAPTITTVLLQGESGTGKEVIARAIHAHSLRNSSIFMPVDCAAINESVIESELFGHTKGAFTGADRSTLGLIRSSDGGTLFLDEIAELPLTLQAKLLRTLQERTVKPVGSPTLYPVDIRIIAATNCNLAEAVKRGDFRQDLYYRLNAVTMYAPPLRERLSDIPQLCNHFTRKFADEGYPEKTLSTSALSALCKYDWPGNIRELENIIRSALTFSIGATIEPEDLYIAFQPDSDTQAAVQPSSMAYHEKEAICKALNQTTGNRRAAANLLGISEATLYRRIKLYSI
ncbi:MAG: sigma-54 dependent transcriptional regulator [Chlorobium sp.]|uniref:sigma-54 interaction domain-containing protein n=1 Tax=Chlorobium sp. TaxID=1095 RepID=UPI0025C22D94|nr:sigma-54 dependent transcriptional regulator [Chlorobium sp.]MCF8383059.1 sigma-54 dependent transcriptional regulator [Chlorobium sp.]